MQAVVLAGGMGRHIKSELGNSPKPMAIVITRPFLEYVLLFLKENAVEDIIISCGYMRPVIESYFGNGKAWGVKIRYTDEDYLRGTAGSVKLAENLIQDENFIVMNGDTFHDVPVYDLLETHIQHDAMVTMALKASQHPERYGAVRMMENKQIVQFLGKGHAEVNLINTGIYVFNRSVLKFIQPSEYISLETDIFPFLCKLGKLYGYVCEGEFLDLEAPENFKLIKTKLKKYIE